MTLQSSDTFRKTEIEVTILWHIETNRNLSYNIVTHSNRNWSYSIMTHSDKQKLKLRYSDTFRQIEIEVTI